MAWQWAEDVWKHRYTGWVMILSLSVWYLFWCYNVPSPSKAATVLGFVAAIMTFRGDLGGAEKSFWMIVLFSFLLMEIRAIDNRERQDEAARSSARNQEARSFEQIAAGIRTTSDQNEKQFESTSAALKAAISDSEQTMKNTRPQAYIVMNNLKPVKEKPFGIVPGSTIPFEVDYTNTGLDLAKSVVGAETTFVAPLDDKASQIRIGQEFDKWWLSAIKDRRRISVQPQEPEADLFSSQQFNVDDVRQIFSHTATLYVLVRWVYIDSAGGWWVNDQCQGYTDITKTFEITLPCRVHNNHRYRMPKSMVRLLK